MNDAKLHDDPSDVDDAGGEVLVSGPDGIALSMTPEAATETGARLIEHAARAKQDIEADARLRERQGAYSK